MTILGNNNTINITNLEINLGQCLAQVDYILQSHWFPYLHKFKVTGRSLKHISFPNNMIHLKSLVLDNVGKLDSFPESILNLKKLESLSITSSCLTSIPSEISTLSNLLELDLNDNAITDFPISLLKLSSLCRLNLLGNKIHFSPQHLSKLSNLSNLTYFKFYGINTFSDQLDLQSEAFGEDFQHPLSYCKLLPNLTSLCFSFKGQGEENWNINNSLSYADITFSHLPSLGKLSIPSCSLIIFPIEICSCSHLKELDISSNPIFTIPLAISALKLEKFYAKNTSLSCFPKGILSIPSLQILHLDFNHIKDVPDQISQLFNLTSLSLGECDLTVLPDGIGCLTKLVQLNLRDNSLTSLPDSLEYCSRITYISLFSNKFSEFPGVLAHLSRLTRLSISRNQLHSLPDLSKWSDHLSFLQLSSNKFLQFPRSLLSLKNLRFLSLARNELEYLPPDISVFSELRCLHLDSNKLIELPSIETISKMTNLVLFSERKNWRKKHPHGFVAKPMLINGARNILLWECRIPGKPNTPWEGGLYPIKIYFPPEYPSKPPKVQFEPGFFHPNVYTSGTVCLSILDPDKGWKPSLTIPQILLGVQTLLDTPNPQSPAQSNAIKLFRDDPELYVEKVKVQAKKYSASATISTKS